MKALQFKDKKVSLNEVSMPDEANGEAIIKVTKAGICNTDIEIVEGYFGFAGTLGHEFVGVVESTANKEWQSKRVVADINCACGACDFCSSKNQHHCPNRTVLGIVNRDGAFAEYLKVPYKNLVVVPDSLPDNVAVFAEPVAAALEIQEQLALDKSETVCVIGDGKLGLLISLTLDASGYNVHLIGRHPDRIERMAEFKGKYSLKPDENSYKTVVEATGNPAGFNLALTLTRPRGNLVLKSTYATGFDFNPAMIVVNELNIIGSRCGPMDKAIALLASGKIDVTKLIDESFPLESGREALEKARSKGVLKILIDID